MNTGRPNGCHLQPQIAQRIASWPSVRCIHCQIRASEHGTNECPHLLELEDIRREDSRLATDSVKHIDRMCFGFRHNVQVAPTAIGLIASWAS